MYHAARAFATEALARLPVKQWEYSNNMYSRNEIAGEGRQLKCLVEPFLAGVS